MEKQREAHVHSNATGVNASAMRPEINALTNLGKHQLHDLSRLRIERNKAARHARCSTFRQK